MGRPRKAVVDGEAPEAGEAGDVNVKFLRLWSSDRGLYLPGVKAVLPSLLAEALEGEGVVEVE